MDLLRELFPTRSQAELRGSFDASGEDVNAAIDRLLTGPPLTPPLRPKVEPSEPSPTSSADSFQLLRISDLESDDESEVGPSELRSPPGEGRKGPTEDDTISKTLALFPDCTVNHIKKLYKEHYILQGANIVEYLVEHFLENGYERVQRGGQKRKRPMEDATPNPDYMSPDRAPVNDEYKILVRKLLQQEFPLVPAQHIGKMLVQNNYFLAPTYADLDQGERDFVANGGSKSYKRLLSARKIVDNDRMKMGKGWSSVTDELDFARSQARTSQMKNQLEKDAQLASEMNEKEHADTGNLWECGCCFGEYPFDSMTHCNEVHFFCMDCARRNAENEVGNGRHKLCCMDASGCKAEFPRREVLRFLDEKTLSALAKAQQEEALRLADIDGLEQCPFCDYAAICEPIEVNKEFICLNPECGEISCRHCNRKSHIPMTCEENAKEDKISHRHHLEEAMTEALIRKCKKCSSPYIKEYGCNKVVCHRCGVLQCYICQNIVKDYSHFNDPSRGGKAGNCPLFDNTEERHEEEVQAAAKETMAKLRQENPELEEEDLDIKLSEEVKKREAARREAGRVPAHLHGPRVIHHNQVALPIAPPLAIPGAGIPPPFDPPPLMQPLLFAPQVFAAPPAPVPVIVQRPAVLRRVDPRMNGREQQLAQQPQNFLHQRQPVNFFNMQPPQPIPLQQMPYMQPFAQPLGMAPAPNGVMQDMMNIFVPPNNPYPQPNAAQRAFVSGQRPNPAAAQWAAEAQAPLRRRR